MRWRKQTPAVFTPAAIAGVVLATIARTIVSIVLTLAAADPAQARPVEIPIANPFDDGEEVNDLFWCPDASPLRLGRPTGGSVHDLAFRFVTPELVLADTVLFARLRFSSRGGELENSLAYVVSGALEIVSPPLSQDRRPSRLPRTGSLVLSTVKEAWPPDDGDPLFCYSDDISQIINEIIRQPGWRSDSSALIVCLDVSPAGAGPGDYVACSALSFHGWPVSLQVSRNLDEAFLCHPILVRPKDHSIGIHFVSLVAMEAYAEFGAGGLSQETPRDITPSGQPYEMRIEDLEENTCYLYRLRYRLAGSQDPFEAGPVCNFDTQRSTGCPFTFTVEADSHLWDVWKGRHSTTEALDLYRITLGNVAADAPDFHFSLGDFSMTQYSHSRLDSFERYAVERELLDPVLHSVPFYLVAGNHEGELGWLRVQGDSVVAWAEDARRSLFPNPYPDDFYGGCPDSAYAGTGYRESYYSWDWGDALFVVLDPYWATTTRPYSRRHGAPRTGWDWTLGGEQYEWLYRTLSASDRSWKIVLLHHLTSGVVTDEGVYGRGGIEVVKWDVAHRPTFEWGGEDSTGADVFTSFRPSWDHGPIHDLLVETGVKLVLHGHDHGCAVQELDGITYAECPTPIDPHYGSGYLTGGGYTHGQILPNSGHLRIRVDPEEMILEYVRAYLPGDGVNGHVALRHVIPGPTNLCRTADASDPGLRIIPNPVSDRTALIRFVSTGRAGAGPSTLRIFDASGRLRACLGPQRDHSFVWNRRSVAGLPVSAGVYFCQIRSREEALAGSLVVLR
jgi:hypothetical protein